MIRVLIVEGDTPELQKANNALGRPGNAENYADVLNACTSDLEIRIERPYLSDFRATDLVLDEIDGVVFTGSSVDWSADSSKAKIQRDVMESVLMAGKPVLGSCNGLQLAAVVLGGRVAVSSSGTELGIARDIQLTIEGRVHPLHMGRRSVFSCPCIHRDEVSELPSGALLTATNDHSLVQAMVFEQEGAIFWGTQYHPENSPGQFADLVENDGLFFGGSSLATELRAADSDPYGLEAQRLGARKDDLVFRTRTRELANWLAMLNKM